MKDESDTLIQENRIKTCRWLFYGSAFQVLVFFAVPIIIYPADMIISMASLLCLTIGVLFATFFLGVNIYCVLTDVRRRILYIIFIVFTSLWLIWAFITWSYIEYMDYILH